LQRHGFQEQAVTLPDGSQKYSGNGLPFI